MTRLSVIIPALNEATSLPRLLDALNRQTRLPDEIIVADACSTDGTDALALARGATVVAGGRPATGRNAGARAATGDLLLFLDADVLPERDFLACALDEFTRAGYAVATCRLAPLEPNSLDRLLLDFGNTYMQLTRPIAPHAPGCCIFSRRTVHRDIGGFDEALCLGEDHDYVRRASRRGPFGTLKGVSLPVSMRRFSKEGIASVALKYLWCEWHVLTGTPMYKTPFSYSFGAHSQPRTSPEPNGIAGEVRPVPHTVLDHRTSMPN